MGRIGGLGRGRGNGTSSAIAGDVPVQAHYDVVWPFGGALFAGLEASLLGAWLCWRGDEGGEDAPGAARAGWRSD